MKTFRIFTQDRGKKFSALRELKASDAREAVISVPSGWHPVAIEWPPTAEGRAWLAKNVD
jgi:hypothetical protein